MVECLFNESHGQREQGSVKFLARTLNILQKKYQRAVVVFDGYLEMSTKDMTHQRRLESKSGPIVTFSKEYAPQYEQK